MKSMYKKLVSGLVLMVVCTLSIGYAAFGSEISISNIVAEVRIAADIRVTSFVYSSATDGGLSQYENYDVDSVVGGGNFTYC